MDPIRSSPRPRVLLVEPDPTSGELMAWVCGRQGYEYQWARSLGEGRKLLFRWRPDLLVVDLPRFPRATEELLTPGQGHIATLIVVSSSHSLDDVRAAFASGAEDYIRKPFNPDELSARLEVALKYRKYVQELARGGNYTVLLERGRLRLRVPGARSVDLTPREAKLIRRLLIRPNVAVSREALLIAGWGRDLPTNDNALDACIRRLRRKVEREPDRPELLVTVRGVGYMLRSES